MFHIIGNVVKIRQLINQRRLKNERIHTTRWWCDGRNGYSNIGAFIAWGLITALFIPTGWVPNEGLSEMVGPMIVSLLPILIGYTGGKMVHGHRGGVIGAVVTTAIVVGSTTSQFLGAMAMGPLAAWVQKKVDGALQPATPEGFEMLVDNFSLGILGTILAVVSKNVIGPNLARNNRFLRKCSWCISRRRSSTISRHSY